MEHAPPAPCRRAGRGQLRDLAQRRTAPRFLLHGRGQGRVPDGRERRRAGRRALRADPLGLAARSGRHPRPTSSLCGKVALLRRLSAAIAAGQGSSFPTFFVWHRPDLSEVVVCRLEEWVDGPRKAFGLGPQAFAELIRDLPRWEGGPVALSHVSGRQSASMHRPTAASGASGGVPRMGVPQVVSGLSRSGQPTALWKPRAGPVQAESNASIPRRSLTLSQASGGGDCFRFSQMPLNPARVAPR